MSLFAAAHRWGQKTTTKKPPTIMKLGSYTLLKEDPRNIYIT